MENSSSGTEAPPSLPHAQSSPALAHGLDVVPGLLPRAVTDFAAVYETRVNAREAEVNPLHPDPVCEKSVMCRVILLQWPEPVLSNLLPRHLPGVPPRTRRR